ncbi:hypothetical protein GC207_06130 [bacterium]|nr:hypothetical protein [bacterium]
MSAFRRIWVWGNLCLLLGSGHVNAATCIWTGTKNGLWSNPANWTNGIIPQLWDTLVFPDNANVRDTINDFPLDPTLPYLPVADIRFEGRGYTLAGEQINLEGNITSVPSLSTNRIFLDLSLGSNVVTIANEGYFNQLELGGNIWMHTNPLVLETISDIVVSGRINDPNGVGIVFRSRSQGRLTVVDGGIIEGALYADHGTVTFGNGSFGGKLKDLPPPHPPNPHSQLIIGNDVDPPGTAQVRLLKSALIDAGVPIVINHSGVLHIDSEFYPSGITQVFPGISGTGVIKLDNNYLRIDPSAQSSSFGGRIEGTGRLLIGKDPRSSDAIPGRYFELAGDSTFSGPITVQSAELRISGSVSNAPISLTGGSVLSGTGTAKSLTSNGGIIRPGAGTLRILNDCSLDFWTQLWIHLDGPDQGQFHAGTLELNNAYFGPIYDGTGNQSSYTIVSTDAGVSSLLRRGTVNLPEGAWLLMGNPTDEFQITYTANAGHDVVLNYFGAYSPPTLSINRVSASESVISWPLSAHDFQLQRTSPENLGRWSTNDLPTANTNNTDHFVVETNSLTSRFYRLIR